MKKQLVFISEKELLRKIAANLKKYRKVRALTQEDIIDQVDFHLVSYQRMESKRATNIRIYNLYQIALVLEIPIDDLLK